MRPPSPTRRSDGVSTVFAASVPPLVKMTFLALAADQCRDLLPRPLDRAPGGAALGMHRGRHCRGESSARAIAAATSGRTGVVALWSR